MAYCSTSDDFLFLLHFALVFWIRHGSILRFHVESIWRHRHLLISPPMWQPHPIFFAQISSISELPYYVTTIFDAYSSASCTCTPLSNHSLSYFHFYPFFFCKIKVKINFFSPLTLSLDNSKKLCENYSIEFSGADHFYHFHKKIKKNNSIFQ